MRIFFSALLQKIPQNILIFCIAGLRPLLGPASCRYRIGCTQFSIEKLETLSLLPALWAISKRILSCNPWTKDFSD